MDKITLAGGGGGGGGGGGSSHKTKIICTYLVENSMLSLTVAIF